MPTTGSDLLRSRCATGVINHPGCVANPPQLVPYRGGMVPRTQLYGDAYRGYDHRFCAHPSPLPAGTQRCLGDPGCSIRIPAGRKPMCFFHNDLLYGLNPDRTIAMQQLMGAKPHRAVDAILAG